MDGSNHLKSFMNMAGPDVISVGAGPEAQSVLKRMEREATHRSINKHECLCLFGC